MPFRIIYMIYMYIFCLMKQFLPTSDILPLLIHESYDAKNIEALLGEVLAPFSLHIFTLCSLLLNSHLCPEFCSNLGANKLSSFLQTHPPGIRLFPHIQSWRLLEFQSLEVRLCRCLMQFILAGDPSH